MDEKSEVFQMLLDKLPCDMEWGDVGMDAVYKELQLKRYFMPALKKFQADTHKDVQTEFFTSSASGGNSVSLASIFDGASAASSSSALQNPSSLENEFKSHLNIMKSAKGQSCCCSMEDICVGEARLFFGESFKLCRTIGATQLAGR